MVRHLSYNGKSILLKTKRNILRETWNAQKPTSIGRLTGKLEQLIAAVVVMIACKSSRVRRRLAEVTPNKITNRARSEHIFQRGIISSSSADQKQLFWLAIADNLAKY